jgi:hypothetical protein
MGPPTQVDMESPEICIDCTANINDHLGNYVGCECAQQRAPVELQQLDTKLQQLIHWASLESAGCSIRELESVADKLADIEARCAWIVHHSTQLTFVTVRVRLNREVIKIIERSCRRISFLQSQRSVRDDAVFGWRLRASSTSSYLYARAGGARQPCMALGAHPAPPQNGWKWSAEKFKDMFGHQREQAQHAG